MLAYIDEQNEHQSILLVHLKLHVKHIYSDIECMQTQTAMTFFKFDVMSPRQPHIEQYNASMWYVAVLKRVAYYKVEQYITSC